MPIHDGTRVDGIRPDVLNLERNRIAIRFSRDEALPDLCGRRLAQTLEQTDRSAVPTPSRTKRTPLPVQATRSEPKGERRLVWLGWRRSAKSLQ
jgi:hypothetical protein